MYGTCIRRLATVLTSLCIACAAALLCAGCDSEPFEFEAPANTGSPDTTWTVLMYCCGSDLESEGGLASENLDEVMDANLNGKVNFVVETGGASHWSNRAIDAKHLNRYVVQNGTLQHVGQLKNASMGEASTLADFISWGTTAYPADRTMLLFWDHGGGSLTGVCADELHPLGKDQPDTLTLPEIRKGLKKADKHFDVIGFDTCLMATLETAEIAAPYGDYLVASEEYEPGGGWAYREWTDWLAQYPGMEPADLGRGICDSYYAKCAAFWMNDMATLSVVDLKKIPALAEAFRNVSSEIVLTTSDAERFSALVRGAARAENYGGNTQADGFTDMVDLGDLMHNTSSVLGNHTDSVLKALKSAVTYSVHGPERSRAQGLSVFYPLAISKGIYKQYAEITDNTAYLQYLAVLNGDYSALDWDKHASKEEQKLEPVEENDYKLKYSQRVDNDNHLRLAITSGIEKVASVRFMLGYFNEDDGTYLELGTDNNLDGNWQTGIFTDMFEGEWITIGGAYVNAQLVEETEEHNLYTVPVKINGKKSNLKLVWRHDAQEFAVLGAYDGLDNAGMSGKSMRPLNDGDKIDFLFIAANLNTGDSEEVVLNSITWTQGTKAQDSDLGDGDYLYRYEIVDMFGDTTLTDPVLMHYKNGAIELEEL